MLPRFRSCTTDADLAQFTLAFIRQRSDFNSLFRLVDVLAMMLETLPDSLVILLEDEAGRTIGWIHYQYLNEELLPDPRGEVAFINSVILAEPYRSSRTFFHGFRRLAAHIREENSAVKEVRFFAQTENAYLNRLYAKFASIVEHRDGYHGPEHVYATDFSRLLSYLRC
ncbi:GNAT family N-acetyltransferase [Brevibacillus sp. TJ4]|uniref:GNAT family N-acetyltransferase n=1 Tax=Brevibacillus sp. TJ4 TaxID=3234853 RepID=UPI0037D227E9